VSEVVAEQLIVRNRKKKELTAELLKRGYDRFPDEKKLKNKKKDNESDEDDEEEDLTEKTETSLKKPPSKASKDKVKMDNLDKDYDYLLSMKIWSLTAEYIELLKKKLAEKKEELDNLSARTPRDMWEEDLDYFMELWDVFEKELNDFENIVGKSGKKKIKMPTLQANARAKAKERAFQRAKERENGKSEMSIDKASSLSESESVVITATTKPLSSKSAPGGGNTKKPNSTTTKTTKATLKKKDEIGTKKGNRTLHEFFSLETSNSVSSPEKKSKKVSSKDNSKISENKKQLSKSQVVENKPKNSQKPPPKRKKSKSEVTTKNDSEDESYYYSETETRKSNRESDSVFDSKDDDSGDNADSESETDSEEIGQKEKKHVTRKNNPKPKKNFNS